MNIALVAHDNKKGEITMRKYTTESAIKLATTQLTNDITGLSAQRDSALSTFRQTAVQQNNINDGLRIKLGNLSELESFIQSQKDCADKMISDNDTYKLEEIVNDEEWTSGQPVITKIANENME